MPLITAITDKIIQDAITHAVQNVCKTMLQWDANLRNRTNQAAETSAYQLISNVGFVGDANGVVYLCLSEDFARHATGKMLGMSSGELEKQGLVAVKDALAEITNMMAGGFKNRLCDIGYPCKLTLPTILRGLNLQVSAIKSATRHIFEFECQGHKFVADIQIKAE